MTKVDIAVLLEADADKLPDLHFNSAGELVPDASADSSATPEPEEQSLTSSEAARLKR